MVDVRQYIGVFTGKTVKPEAGEDISKFSKHDKVVVFNLEDYVDFLKDMDTISHGTPEEVEEVTKRLNL